MKEVPIITGRFAPALLAALLLMLAAHQASAQELPGSPEECSAGTLFYVTFPDTVWNQQDDRFAAKYEDVFTLYVYSPVDQNIRISGAAQLSVTRHVQEGEVLEIDTKQMPPPLITVINAPQLKVLKIEAETPVIIYAYMATRFGCAAYTLIPVESWGTEYYSASWEPDIIRHIHPAGENNFETTADEAPAEIVVIAAFDNTIVRITPKAALERCAGCTSVKLNAGEAYLVESYVDTNAERQPDIAGSFIQSNKRIGVISGNTRLWHEPYTDGTLAANSFKDLVAEMIAPIDQHGREFVFMPTMDELRQRPFAATQREREYVRVYSTTTEPTEILWYNTLGIQTPAQNTPVDSGDYTHERIGVLTQGIAFLTSKNAQAYQSPRPVTKFNGTTGSGNFIGASYEAWSTYMTEMVPRIQWTYFAAFEPPSYPTSMRHYVNVVTDSGSKEDIYFTRGSSAPQPFFFNHGKIPGTDLVWGSMSLNPGIEYTLQGDKGARFSGFVYGSWGGYELYRPGGTRKEEDDKGRATAGGENDHLPEILHPSEYEENTAMMYGFPLPPSRCVIAPPDDYEVTIDTNCQEMLITIRATNADPVGIRYVRLIDPVNADLDFIQPESSLVLRENNVSLVKLRLKAIDILQDASAILEFKDRSREGMIHRIPFKYQAERIDVEPAGGLDFGKVTVNTEADEQGVTITNPLEQEITVKELDFAFGNQDFEILRTEPEFDWNGDRDPNFDPKSVVLKPGESMKVWITIRPTEKNRTYGDSLMVTLGCVTVSIPLKAATVQPCLHVDDLDFGTLSLDASKTLPLRICNLGDGFITFEDSTSTGGGAFLTWLLSEFTVSSGDINKLRDAKLGPGECVEIAVTFVSGKRGFYRTTGRFWASTRDCRDTSVWTARVTEPGPQITGHDWKERWLSSDDPCTKNDTVEYEWEIEVSNTGDQAFTVERIAIVDDPTEAFRIVDPGNIVNGKRINAGITERVRVAFKPVDEGIYSAFIRLYYRIDGTLDSIQGPLDGVGIESYIVIGDHDFGRHFFPAPGSVRIPYTFTLQSTGTREVTITGISINGTDATDFPQGDIRYISPNTSGPPFTLQPDEVQTIEVIFDPQDTDPLRKAATIDIRGDFADAGCSRSDSSGELVGEIYTLDAVAEGFDFGSALTCFDRDGFIVVTNPTSDPVMITKMGDPVPGNQYFSLDPAGTLTLPFRLAGGEQVKIPVRFAPEVPGNYRATVEFEVTDENMATVISRPTAELTGSGEIISLNFSVDKGYTQLPGLPLTIPVRLNASPDMPDDADITRFRIEITYDQGMMLIQNVEPGSLIPQSDGWVIDEVSRSPGHILFDIENTTGRSLNGAGEVLILHYITYIGDVTTSEITPVGEILASGTNEFPCVETTNTPGDARLDSICGLNFRLIETFASRYAIQGVTPNVTDGSTDIRFSLGLDAQTRIEVFDGRGDRVALLVDEYLQPGGYQVTWNTEGNPQGRYFFRITSGEWTDVGEIVVRR